MERTLKNYRPGDSGIVKQVIGTGAIKRRMFDMGVTPGTKITMRKTAPLGDPIEITLRGYELSIRKTEAEIVIMTDIAKGGVSK